MSTNKPFMHTERVWLDHQAFAQHTLLSGQTPPWQEPTALAAWLSKAQGLLNQSAVVVAIEPGLRAWIEDQPMLITDLKASKGVLGPVKMLCAHPDFNAWLAQLCTALHTQLPPGRWALQWPAPAWWIHYLTTLTKGHDSIAVDPEDAEDAAVYVANALRSLPAHTLQVLIMDTRLPGGGDLSAGADTLQRIASHYQWSFGLRGKQRQMNAPQGVDFEVLELLGHESMAHRHRIGLSTTLSCAASALSTTAEADHDFIVVELPADEAPEHVLPALRALTGSH